MRELLIQERVSVDSIGFAMTEENVKLFLSHPLGMPASDCSAYSPVGKLSEVCLIQGLTVLFPDF